MVSSTWRRLFQADNFAVAGEAHDKKCGSCAGQLSACGGVVPLHARTS